MSIAAVAWALDQDVKDSTAKLILICLANFSNEHNQSFPSYKTIMKVACCSKPTAIKKMDILIDAGLVSKEAKKRDDGSDTSNIYTLNLGVNRFDTPVNPGLYPPGKAGFTPYEPSYEPKKDIPIGISKENGSDDLFEADPQASSPAKPKKASLRGERLPKDWVVPEKWVTEGIAKYGCGAGPIRLEAEKFANYWWAKSGRDAAKLDWHATWRNWLITADSNGSLRKQQEKRRNNGEPVRSTALIDQILGDRQ